MSAGVQASRERCEATEIGVRCSLAVGHHAPHHFPERGVVSCPECGKECADLRGLAAHRRTHGVHHSSAPVPPITPPLVSVALPPPSEEDPLTIVITHRILEVARAVAFLEDETVDEVLDGVLDRWADERFEDADVADLVRILRRKREH